jgi:hypothetical protein
MEVYQKLAPYRCHETLSNIVGKMRGREGITQDHFRRIGSNKPIGDHFFIYCFIYNKNYNVGWMRGTLLYHNPSLHRMSMWPPPSYFR